VRHLASLPFLLALVFLLVHELDAVRCREWRFFLARFGVDDATGSRLFVGLHAPILLAVLWWLSSPTLQAGLAGFAVVHAGLHVWLRDHPRLAFAGPLSWTWILGAGVAGAAHLLLLVV
jgi:hypothetical protein